MGLGDLVDDVGDGLENLATGAEHLAGKVVDGGSHLIGDGLDAVGLHGAAQSVDGFGDSVADHLGDQVAEKQLGQSDDPTQLVHGDVGAISQTASRLQEFAAAFGETAQGLAGIDTAGWHGVTADAFRQVYQAHPRQWSDAQDACKTASSAWRTFSDAVTAAQGQAREAITLYNQANQATQAAQARYDQAQATYNQQAWAYVQNVAAGRDPGPQTQPPGPFSDPGTAGRQHAQDLLTTARQARDTAAETAERALNQAMAQAPTTPKFTQRMLDDLGDATTLASVEGEHFLGGALKGVGDLGKFARTLLPFDPYNITHPAEYVDGLSSTAAGLVHTALHPMSLVTGLLGSGWGSDPAEALGMLVPNLIGVVGSDGTFEAADAAEAASTTTRVAGAAQDADGVAARGASDDAGARAPVGNAGMSQPGLVAREPAIQVGRAPALDPADTQGISGDLGEFEHDLAKIHVHETEPTTVSAAPSPAPPTSVHGGVSDGGSAIQQRLAGLHSTGTDRVGLRDGGSTDTSSSGSSGEGPPSSDSSPPSARTDGGATGGAGASHAGPVLESAEADSIAAQGVRDSGAGLAAVERDLDRFHLGHSEDVSEPSIWPPSNGNLLDGRSVGGFELTPPDPTPPTLRTTASNPAPADGAHPDPQQQYLTRYPPSVDDQEWLAEIRTRWPEAHRLSDAELLALHQYKTSAYELNRALRSGNVAQIESLAPEIHTTSSALARLPDFHGRVVRARGVGLTPDQLDQALERYTPGTVVSEPSFTSTAKSPPGYGVIEYHITSLSGKDISPLLDQDSGVQEVLFPPDSRFRVDHRFFNSTAQKWQIYLSDVGQ